jgi:hypothetical protein
MLKEPVLNYDFALEAAAEAGGWQDANRYTVWVGRQAPDDQQYEVLERREQGIVPMARLGRRHDLPALRPGRVGLSHAPDGDEPAGQDRPAAVPLPRLRH